MNEPPHERGQHVLLNNGVWFVYPLDSKFDIDDNNNLTVTHPNGNVIGVIRDWSVIRPHNGVN